MQKTINSEALLAALSQHGLTQRELAEQVGVSSQAVTNWVKGKDFPRPPKLLKLSTVLRLGFDQLVDTVDEGRPIVAFRKKANAKTTELHTSQAVAVGKLLKPLVAFLPDIQALRTLITSPSTEYLKLEHAVMQTRARLGIGSQAVLGYEHIIREFKTSGAVLVPVMWGSKGKHENALHIRLPKEDVTFVFLNLDTRLEDFKFWMAHELAHVYTPDLAGTNEGEDFADAFAAALLFPRICAEAAYHDAAAQRSATDVLGVLQKHAQLHMISLNTVYQQVKLYAKSAQHLPLAVDEKRMHATRNTSPANLVSQALFDPLPPTPDVYISACQNTFETDFFHALQRMIRENGIGPSYIQQVMAIPLQDAHALHERLRH